MDAKNQDFNSQVIAGVADKELWYNDVKLPKIHEAYRLHLTCIDTLLDAMVKKSLVVPDPYQKDKKISNISNPKDTPFGENERPTQLGVRLGDYQSMLDYICNYIKFSVDQLNLDKIRRMLQLSVAFNWQNLSPNSTKDNTRALATCIALAKSGAQPIQVAVISESLSKAKESMAEIVAGLKELEDFKKERYKADIRKNVLCSKYFDKKKMENPGAMLLEMKRVFQIEIPKNPFSQELIEQIVQEETAPNKEQLRARVLSKLAIEVEKSERVEKEVDLHELLMEAIRILATTCETYQIILEKIMNNNKVLQMGRNSLKDKIARFFRKLFGRKEPEVEYNITIVGKGSEQNHREKLNFNEFVANLSKRTKYYASICVKNTPGYVKINAKSDAALSEFLNKQIVDNGRLQVVLGGLDEFFKISAQPADRPKIKGLKMELTTLKNIIVKSNQIRAEYSSIVEENEQLKKMGIK